MRKTIFIVSMGVLFLSLFAHLKTEGSSELSSEAKEASFSVSGPGIQKTFNKSDLLKMSGLRTIEVEKDPGYGQTKQTYLAIPANELFKGMKLNPDATMSFKCTDGFAGAISLKRVLNRDSAQSIADIAIETSDKKWPNIPGKTVSAGPFYLIWDHPEKSKIVTDEWPFQLAALEVKDSSIQQLYPKALPDRSIANNHRIYQGYKAFMTSCFTCHPMNGEGGDKVGPDLNIPYGPSEYFKVNFFGAYIRNPQNLRKWPNARMNGFGPSDVSDEDIKNIWAYFTHMSGRKAKP